MVSLIRELPYAAVVKNDCIPSVCSKCFDTSDGAPFNRCSSCRVIRYCSTACQKADWKDHKMECQFLKRAVSTEPDLVSAPVRLAARILMKISRGDIGKSFNGRTFDDLMDHIDDIKATPLQFVKFTIICGSLRKFMDGQELPDDDRLLSILGKISCNSFGMFDKGRNDIGTGLYLGLSAHDHGCDAAAYVESDGAVLELFAAYGVKYSKQISISYVNGYLSRAERNKSLRENYFFECSCSWCLDPDHEGWALSVRSPCCPDSACLLREDTTELRCHNCGKINKDITVAEARVLNAELSADVVVFEKQDMREGMPGFAAYFHKKVKTYERFAKVFSKWNMNLASFVRRLARMAFLNGRTSVAKKYATAHVIGFRKYLGPGNLDLPSQYINAAGCIGFDTKEAQDMLKEAYALALKSYGPHSNVTMAAAERINNRRGLVNSMSKLGIH